MTDLRSFEFRDGYRRYLVTRAIADDGLDPRWAASLLEQLLRQDFFFGERLASWFRFESVGLGMFDNSQVLQRLIDEVRSGWIRVRELESPRPVYSHQYRQHLPDVRDSSPALGMKPEEEILDKARLLRITACPPCFDPRREPLRIAYLLRDLAGRPVELVIRSQAQPEPPVHRRKLTSIQTTDGPGKLEWDGVDDNSGELVQHPLAPFRVELVHDAICRDEARTTLPPAVVHVVEIEDLVFATGRAILLPDGGFDSPGDTAKLTGLDAVAAVLRHAAFHEDVTLAIFGHTDTVGSESNNLELSDCRATNALHVVTGDAEAWAAHCDKNYEVADFQRVLAWIARSRGWDTDPGEIDGEFGPVTRTARANFREHMNAEYGTKLKQGTKQGVDDWKAYFMLYDEELLRLLEWSPGDLQRVRHQLRLAEPAAIGCGEAFPADGAGQNNLASAANRRVDFVFFEPDELPELPGDPPGHKLYGTGTYRAEYLPMGPSILTMPLRIRLTRKQQPLSGVDYVIEEAGDIIVEGQTDGSGYVLAEVPRNAQNLFLRVPAFGLVYALEVGEVHPLSTLAGVQDRLANLGYPCSRGGIRDGQTVEALKAFQFAQGLEVTGEVDDNTIARLRAEHGS